MKINFNDNFFGLVVRSTIRLTSSRNTAIHVFSKGYVIIHLIDKRLKYIKNENSTQKSC